MTRALRRSAALLLALLLPLLTAVPARAASLAPPQGPVLHSEAAILMEAETGQVLFEKNAHRRMQPASLTKIMTCLLGMEAGYPTQAVTVTAEATRLMPDAAAIGLQPGETLTLAQLLYAAMLPSANDAANAVGIHIAGSSSAFVNRMNQRARELDLADTSFANANGLPARNHYTTAYDLARITREALRHPEFLDYAGTTSYSIPATAHNHAYGFSHLNRALLPASGSYDSRAIAGKTGWTDSAGNCLMTVAEVDGVRLIAVTLRAGSDGTSADPYPDTQALFDYGFSAFRQQEFSLPAVGFLAESDDTPQYLVPTVETVRLMIPADAPEEGLSLRFSGTATAQNGRLYGSVTLLDGTGTPIWEGGQVPLSATPLAEEPLGPSATVYLLQPQGRFPRLPLIEFAAAAVVVLPVTLFRLLRRRKAAE